MYDMLSIKGADLRVGDIILEDMPNLVTEVTSPAGTAVVVGYRYRTLAKDRHEILPAWCGIECDLVVARQNVTRA